MRAMSFDRFLDDVLVHEGVYSNDPDDPGGETVYGITRRDSEGSYPLFWTYVDRILSDEGVEGLRDSSAIRYWVRRIYRERYWDPLKPDDWPDGTDLLLGKVFNFGVNVGSRQAVRVLQSALNGLGMWGRLVEDGVIGPKTLDVVEEAWCKLGAALLDVYGLYQCHYYVKICRRRPVLRKYLLGWLWNRAFYETTLEVG